MTLVRAHVSIPASSQSSEDVVVNVWHFDVTDAATEGNLTPVTTAMGAFYQSLVTSFSSLQLWTGARVKYYNLADPQPRAPLQDVSLGLTGTGGSPPLPKEIAVCMSFQGTQLSGTSQARRRGRLYLGPFSTLALSSSGLLSDSTRSTIASAASTFLTASNAAAGWAWTIWSPTTSIMIPVDNGWIDNALDIQRRRGVDATARTTFG